jgi:hypothetical protein
MLESRVRTAEQLAGKLGASVWSLKRWAQLYGKDSAAGGPPEGWRPGGSRRGGPSGGKCAAGRELEFVSRQRDIFRPSAKAQPIIATVTGPPWFAPSN